MADVEMDAEWVAALAHAELSGDALQVGFAGPLHADAGAQFTPPGTIVLRLSDDAALVAGWLRHELEHVKQHRAYGEEGRALYDLVRCVLTGCPRLFFNLVPAEVDANAAAAAHLRARYPEHVERLSASEQCQLIWTPDGPQPLRSLPVRMVAFAFTFRERCEALASERGAVSVAELLDTAFPGTGGVWRNLVEVDLGPRAGARSGAVDRNTCDGARPDAGYF